MTSCANSPIVQRRYRSGVGTILELLGTQTALARQQRVEALTAWGCDDWGWHPR